MSNTVLILLALLCLLVAAGVVLLFLLYRVVWCISANQCDIAKDFMMGLKKIETNQTDIATSILNSVHAFRRQLLSGKDTPDSEVIPSGLRLNNTIESSEIDRKDGQD